MVSYAYTLHPKVAGPQRSPILGVPSIDAYTPFVAELSNLTWQHV